MKKSTKNAQFEAVVIGASAGGIEALSTILPILPSFFPLPVIIAQHLHPKSDGYLVEFLNKQCSLTVKEAEDKERIKSGHIYLAPANYHLLIERDRSFSFNADEPVNFSRPSIDMLFETAADAYGHQLIGVILTGANNDGSMGLCKIQSLGGLIIIQDPKTAAIPRMPLSAIEKVNADYICSLPEIGFKLRELTQCETTD